MSGRRESGHGGPAKGPGHGGPARGYRWEPFKVGNEVRLRHGARSERRVDPVAAELVEALLADRPDLAAYPEAVWGWARAEARCLLFAHWHAQVGYLDEAGNPRGGGHVARPRTRRPASGSASASTRSAMCSCRRRRPRRSPWSLTLRVSGSVAGRCWSGAVPSWPPATTGGRR
jgi:hypothetical protein